MRIFVTVLAPFALALVAAQAEEAAPAKSKTDDAARRLFRRKCRACHDPNRVLHRSAGRAEWREIVERMRRMPQSGISRSDAATILDYLVSLHVTPIEKAARAGEAKGRLGGRRAFGAEWISILEVATVRNGKVSVGGHEYAAQPEGRSLTLTSGEKKAFVSLDAQGKPERTTRIDSWNLGKVRYELHLVLYEIRKKRFRVGIGLRKRARSSSEG
ncbi:MAG: hypothetical protein ACYTGZ_09660 [Planctomycetota bacterium]|jgi:hypothetical protein